MCHVFNTVMVKSTMQRDIFIGLGGNLDGTRACFDQVCVALEERIGPIRERSRLYRSRPWGFDAQPHFLNAVLQVGTDLEPTVLLAELQGIERDLGKAVLHRNGPRLIDLDLLFYGEVVVASEGLRVPHPHVCERDFVLLPLCELAPAFIHPECGKSIRELVAVLPEHFVEGVPEAW